MDIADISKISNRKRINTDAEKLKEKVSRETAKIIKLKVAQDTAYWDLKQKLQEVEGNHERLQRNMLDVQMQHEAASAHLADERRLRPETLNKLSGTREICATLEEYVGRVRGSLQRAAADRDALSETYARAGQAVSEARGDVERRIAAITARASTLAATVALSERSGARLEASMAALQRQAEASENEWRARLAASDATAAAASDRANALVTELVNRDCSLREKEATIAAVRDEMREMSVRSERAIAELQRELRLTGERAVGAEARSQAAEREAAKLQGALAAATEARDALSTDLQQLRATHSEAESMNERLNLQAEDLKGKIMELQKIIQNRERDYAELAERNEKTAQEAIARSEEITHLTEELRRIGNEAATTATTLAKAETRLQQLEEACATAERELAQRADTVAQLMRDVAAEAEARARSDTTLRAKDDELAGQMKMILELRSEKERLCDKIRGMQGTIDNIQKELTLEGRSKVAAHPHPPEHDDDNAVAAPPRLLRQDSHAAGGNFAVPKTTTRGTLNEQIYNFFSDSSADADALDPTEVNRRFEALSRGEPLPNVPLRSLTRRNVTRARIQEELSLSQVKQTMQSKGRTFFKNKRPEHKQPK